MKRLIILLNLTSFYFFCEEKKCQKIISKEISIACDSRGYPKKKALKSLVAGLYLNHISQNEQNTISIKEMPGGHYTAKMYLVFALQNGQEVPLFFFKISNKIKSTENLIKLQEGPVGQKFQELTNSTRNSYTNLPEIIWLENIFTYKDKDGNQKTIEITPSAQGKMIKDILDSGNINLIKKCALALGKSLATFHLIFMNYHDSDKPSDWKTICHRDFSIKNAFFNPITNKVSFIDNETMDTASIGQDIKTILVSLMMFYYIKKNNSTRWPLYLEYCLSFLKGYIESYPLEHRAKLASFIEKVLTDDLNKTLYTKIIINSSFSGKEFNEKEFKQVVYSYLHSFKN